MMPIQRFPSLRGLRFATPVAFAVACGPAHAELTVRLSPAEEGDGDVLFELVNEGDEPVTVLRSDTPLETPLAADAFDVSRTVKGWPAVERPVYTGRLYKRTAPRPEDFIRLAPGETASATVPLERYYDVPDGGDYKVSFDGTIRVAPDAPSAESSTGPTDTAAPAARVRADGFALVTPGSDTVAVSLRPGRAIERVRPPAFDSCDAEQQEIIVEATGAAEQIAGEALQSLAQLPESQRANAPRYAQWFGEYTPERYGIVGNGFDRIYGALTGETLGVSCDCEPELDDVYAYVRPAFPYDITVCGAFFATGLLGIDSRAGTFVHELSHFTVLMGTQDNVYSQRAAAELALTDPDRAVNNADSVEYFAENEPALPMSGDGGPVALPGNGTPTPVPPSNTSRYANLPIGEILGGTLAEGEFALYEADGADKISLNSVEGDADLYVFDDPSPDEASLVCASESYSEEATVDVCPLPSNGNWYIFVRGFSASRYQILAEAVNVGGTSPGGLAPVAPSPAGLDPLPADDGAPGVLGPIASGGSSGGGGSGGGALGWGAFGLLGASFLTRRAGAGRSA